MGLNRIKGSGLASAFPVHFPGPSRSQARLVPVLAQALARASALQAVQAQLGLNAGEVCIGLLQGALNFVRLDFSSQVQDELGEL